MLSRQDIVNRIDFIVPNAEYAMWDYTGSKDDGNATIQINGWCIQWMQANKYRCPTEAELRAISSQDLANDIENKRKAVRDSSSKNNLALVSAYSVAKQSNANLTFSAYLDSLEKMASEIDGA